VTIKKTPCVSFFMANHYAPYLGRKKRWSEGWRTHEYFGNPPAYQSRARGLHPTLG